MQNASYTHDSKSYKNTVMGFTIKPGFTIVELLVVIVVIGILATISLISYTGISIQAVIASSKADLANASKQIKMYQIENGSMPTSIDCSVPKPDPPKICIKSSGDNIFSYQYDNTTTPQSFCLISTLPNGTSYYIDYKGTPTLGSSCPLVIPTVTIGTQTWMAKNLNVGVMLTAPAAQTNNGTVEKYCYNNNPSNCDIYGGLYAQGEALNYLEIEGTQGICPSGFHLPRKTEFETLFTFLGGEAVAEPKLMIGGSSGFEAPLGGNYGSGVFGDYVMGTDGVYWTSTNFSAMPGYSWDRIISTNPAAETYWANMDSDWALSARCIKD